MKRIFKNQLKSRIIYIVLTMFIVGCDKPEQSKFIPVLDPVTFSQEIFSLYQVTPDEAMEWMYDSTQSVFIDIRNKIDFEKGHLENAINIPVIKLLENEYIKQYMGWLNDSLTVVLYGNDELQANAPWMLMYQLGFTNMRLLHGGYSYIDRLYTGEIEEGESFLVEDPMYDYAGILKEVKENSAKIVEKKVKPKKKVTTIKKIKQVDEGGC